MEAELESMSLRKLGNLFPIVISEHNPLCMIYTCLKKTS